MLPKVANTILHHTSRAVAAVQSQTGYAFRNVLQSSSGGTTTANWSGASSSGWSGAGSGPGGAKYHSSSRFYNGYTGAGRSITQANQSAINDSSPSQIDENDDLHLLSGLSPVSRKFRTRSNSLSLGSRGKNERADKLGVLAIVQLHARARHAFAVSKPDKADTLSLIESDISRPTLARRNSTSTTASSPAVDPTSFLPSAPQVEQQTDSFDPLDPVAPQTVITRQDNDIRRALHHYLATGSRDVFSYVARLLDTNSMPPDIMSYEIALEALCENRKGGTTVNTNIRLYEHMVKCGLVPTARIYSAMLKALGDRDLEIQITMTNVEMRMRRRQISNRGSGNHARNDAELLTRLKAEDNFKPAIRLFKALSASRLTVPQFVFSILLRSCAMHGDEFTAVQVFAYLGRCHPSFMPVAAYHHMISLYGKVNKLESAVAIFAEFRKTVGARRVMTKDGDKSNDTLSLNSPWNKMIEVYFTFGRPAEALSLLENMLDSNGDAPEPDSFTYYTIVSGFCQNGDMPTAIVWFRRLLQETNIDKDSDARDPPKADLNMWRHMINALAERGMVNELNELYDLWSKKYVVDMQHIAQDDRLMVAEANLNYLETHLDLTRDEAYSKLDFILHHILEGSAANWSPYFGTHETRVCERVIQLYERYDDIDKATTILFEFVDAQKAVVAAAAPAAEQLQMRIKNYLRNMSLGAAERMMSRDGKTLSFAQATRLLNILRGNGLFPSPNVVSAYIAIYEDAKEKQQVRHLTQQDVEQLISAGVTLCYVKPGSEVVDGSRFLAQFESILADTTRYISDLSAISNRTFEGIMQALLMWYSRNDLANVFAKLGPDWQVVWNHPKVQEVFRHVTNAHETLNTLEVTPEASVNVNPTPDSVIKFKLSAPISRSIDEILNNFKNPTPLLAYGLFITALRDGTYPYPDTLGRLINALGREKEQDKVRFVYQAAHHALSVAESENAAPQSSGWFEIEDQMVIALAHSGDIEGAHAHRLRILEYGSAPSADAYGALIRCVKDTTDDSANAYNLFRESQIRGVVPNVFLYNTMISKLAKARKADYALDLFHKMKASGFWPSSVSYGAVIGACCRVGDHQSAEQLFQEMSSQQNFKPRIPPYNTMMQLYTYTKPNREHVLRYYNALLKAKIRPTAHTYKLLMDAYGTIEPINLEAMQETFTRLRADANVMVQGTHWGSMINAYGCIAKDLNKAIEIFDGIANHPSTQKSGTPMPDAVTYEALINVFVTLRRTDLIAAYMARLQASGVHMTAYIANLLIKGYAVSGNLEKAREVFEGLADPEQGVAAPNNHAPHESSSAMKVSPHAPVYREPSTWEAMVRAELGNGNREAAVALLQRMQDRRFPAAVYSRISGIMLDDTVSPWPSQSPTSFSTSPDGSSS